MIFNNSAIELEGYKKRAVSPERLPSATRHVRSKSRSKRIVPFSVSTDH